MASTGGHDIPQVVGTELVFVDPDNGLEPASYRETLAVGSRMINDLFLEQVRV